MFSPELIVLILLSVLFFATNVFWLVTVNRLINKMMSRNYGDYVQADKFKRPRIVPNQAEDPALEMLDKKRANELNQIMGMI